MGFPGGILTGERCESRKLVVSLRSGGAQHLGDLLDPRRWFGPCRWFGPRSPLPKKDNLDCGAKNSRRRRRRHVSARLCRSSEWGIAREVFRNLVAARASRWLTTDLFHGKFGFFFYKGEEGIRR